MPTYEYLCEDGHEIEHRCSISAKPDVLTCTEQVEDWTEYYCDECGPAVRPCGKPAKQVFRTAPPIWIPGVTHETVLDYPGSKAQKAGYVGQYGDKPATKVQSGYGGVTSTQYKYHDEIADWVKPDRSKGTDPGSLT